MYDNTALKLIKIDDCSLCSYAIRSISIVHEQSDYYQLFIFKLQNDFVFRIPMANLANKLNQSTELGFYKIPWNLNYQITIHTDIMLHSK